MMERRGYPDGIVRYPVSVAKQPEYDYSTQESVDSLVNKMDGQSSALSDIAKGVSGLNESLSDIRQGLSDIEEKVDSLLPEI